MTFVRLCFFYLDGHHRDLHSFPTRRSSDLVKYWPKAPYSTTLSLGFTPASVSSSAGLRAASRAVSFGGRSADLDRKSTRLNSSHLGISYAVFCLKKKK